MKTTYLWTDSCTFIQHPCHSLFDMASAYKQRNVIHTDAYEMEKCKIPFSFKDHLSWNKSPNGDEEWIFALCRHSMLRALAITAAVTGNEDYANVCFSIWEDFLHIQPHTKENEKTSWRSLEAGLRIEQWLRTLEIMDLSGIMVPSPLMREIEKSIDEHASYLIETHHAFHRLSNWGVIQDHGLLLAGIWKNRNDWVAIAEHRLEEELFLQILPDGVDWEQSPLYHCEVLRLGLDIILVCKHTGYPLPSIMIDTIHRMANALDGMTFGNAILIPQGDSDILSVNDLKTEAAILFKDNRLFSGLMESTYLDFHEDELNRYSNIHPTKKRDSIVLESSGNCCFRKGDFEVFFHAGPLGSGHGHLDAGNVDIIVGGKPVVIDSGRYTYAPVPIRMKLKDPEAHNLVTGNHDAKSKGSWSYESLLQVMGMRTNLTKECDCGECWVYHPYGMISRRRLMVFPDFIVVIDDIFSAHTGIMRWHLDASIKCRALGTGFTCGPLHGTILGVGKTKIVRGETSPEYNRLLANDVLFHTIPPKGHAISIWSRHPIQGEEIPLQYVGDTTIIPSSTGYGIRITRGGKITEIIHFRATDIHQVDLVECGKTQGHGSLLFREDDATSTTFIW